eukprot:TRINITY_DN49822_c0_g2_i2.p1 TRINITY_DN49822_c0_g2~~TRINITY_DN49822_c0_g2_i2.p1  ORF type:complete len:161 (-),score=28.81 TRINITY_DN49822_c0_g2_i2:63-545(-)
MMVTPSIPVGAATAAVADDDVPLPLLPAAALPTDFISTVRYVRNTLAGMAARITFRALVLPLDAMYNSAVFPAVSWALKKSIDDDGDDVVVVAVVVEGSLHPSAAEGVGEDGTAAAAAAADSRVVRSAEGQSTLPVSYTHLRAHETPEHLVCRLLLEKKK